MLWTSHERSMRSVRLCWALLVALLATAAGDVAPATLPHYFWQQVSLGGEHTCGIKSTPELHASGRGELLCWGSNDAGQTEVPEVRSIEADSTPLWSTETLETLPEAPPHRLLRRPVPLLSRPAPSHSPKLTRVECL